MNSLTDNGIIPGFSRKCDDPEILKGVKRWKNTARIAMLVFTIAPALICGVISKGDFSSTCFIIGVILSGIFLFASLLYEIKRACQKQFDGVITDKHKKAKHYVDVNETIATYSEKTFYYIKIKTDDGKVKTIKNTNPMFYDYLNVNDRVRFHPELNGYIEKYDKSHDEYLICPVCFGKNSPENEKCEYCNVPLLK